VHKIDWVTEIEGIKFEEQVLTKPIHSILIKTATA
jgi:hypothetical protein